MFARFIKPTMRLPLAINAIRRMAEYTGGKEKSLNTVQLLGRVGQDPVIRGEKNPFITFSMATNKSYLLKQTGDMEPQYGTKTEWHKISVFRPYLVKRVQDYITKGTRLMVIGSIESSSYKGDDGQETIYMNIVPEDIIIMAGGKEKY